MSLPPKSYYHIKWQDRQAELLRNEIEAILAVLSDVAGFRALVKEPLTKARRGLFVRSVKDQPWPLLPLIVCEAICGHYEHGLPAAASLQLLMAAGDVFDDIEDEDSSESLSARYGSPTATNVATTLLILAEQAITRLKGRGVEDCTIVRVMDVINSFYKTACAGQHMDLSLASAITVSEDTYLRVTRMKSASQIECTCQIGALLANANQELVDMFTAFGRNLGMAAQITNDIQGITQGSDIAKRKISLPLIYALAKTNGEARNQLETFLNKRSESGPDPTKIKDILYSTGAVHYAMVKLEFFKQRALDNLSKADKAGANVERLKQFLR
jgi:geranylgeranyl pyrophosphate synthase